jgi:hypothetical protein
VEQERARLVAGLQNARDPHFYRTQGAEAEMRQQLKAAYELADKARAFLYRDHRHTMVCTVNH